MKSSFSIPPFLKPAAHGSVMNQLNEDLLFLRFINPTAAVAADQSLGEAALSGSNRNPIPYILDRLEYSDCIKKQGVV